jgi:Coenzyme PQQ synthesis protein D (PqqD)
MSLFVRASRIVGREFLSEYLLVPLVGQTAQLTSIYATNELGAFLWKLLEHPVSSQGLVEAVVQVYDVSLEQAAEDCGKFLMQLESVGAVERVV